MIILRRARHKERKSSKKIIIFITAVVSLLVMFILVLGFHGVLFPILNSNNDEIIEGNYVEPVDKATGKANVLLLGVDKDGLRTDTIIIASYNLDENKVNMLSIPRDTRMYIGRQYQKINAAHALSQNGKIKGPQGTIEAVTRLTGIPINYYVEFSCNAFRNTIDALGGVEIDVPQRMKYSDPVQDLYIDLHPGLQLLDGDKAEQLVRFRKYPRGDIQRVEMQQTFVKALAEQKLNITILDNIPEIFKVLQNDVKTNFTIKDILKYLPNLRELSAESINMYSLPGDFSGEQYSGSYWIANINEIKTLVNEVFGYDAKDASVAPKGKSDPEANKATKGTKSNVSKNTKTAETEKNNGKKTGTDDAKDKADSKTEGLTKSTASPKPFSDKDKEKGADKTDSKGDNQTKEKPDDVDKTPIILDEDETIEEKENNSEKDEAKVTEKKAADKNETKDTTDKQVTETNVAVKTENTEKSESANTSSEE